MPRRFFRRSPALLLVLAAAIGCNAISGISDFTTSDLADSSATGGASASGGDAATGGSGNEGGTGGAGEGGVGGGGDGGSGGSAASGGTSGGTAGTSGGTAGTSGGTAGTSGTDAGTDAVNREQCSGGLDDDADTRIDCFDSDCRDDALCAGFCSDAETLPCNVVRRSQLSSAPGSTARIAPPFYGCGGGDEPGPEYAYRLNLPAARSVFVELFGLDANLSVHAVDAAGGAQCDARSGCVAAGASGSGTRAEALAFSSVTGRDYYVIVDGLAAGTYSISVQCSDFDGCVPARAIEAGQTLTGSLLLGSAPNVTQKLTAYSCAPGNRSAPEAAFMFTPTADGDYRIDLTQLTANADLFVLASPNCNATCLSQNSRSVNNASGPESLVLTATAGTTYYIVVDGYATTGFMLGVTQL